MKLINKVVITLVCFTGVYSAFLFFTDIGVIFDKLLNFKIEFLPVIFSLVIFGWLIHGLRWHLLLRNVKINISAKSSFSIWLSGIGLSFIPGEVGDFVKVQILKNKYNVSRAKSSPIILSEWLYTASGLVSLCLLGGVFFEISLYLGCIFGGVLIILFTTANSKKLFTKFLKIGSKIKIISRFSESLTDSFDTMKKSTSGRAAIISCLLSISYWFIESIAVFFIMHGYGINVVQILDIIPMYSSAIVLGYASFLPLGTGVVEGALGTFLQSYGVEFAVAFSVVVVIRLFTRWSGILVGLFALRHNDGFKILKEF